MLKKWHILSSITLAVSLIAVLSISAEDSLIPSWIKSTAGFWANNQISDKEFISALQWLIDNDILTVSQKESQITESEQEIANLNSNKDSTQQNLEIKMDHLPRTRDECIPGKLCFVPGNYVTYHSFLDDELLTIINYTYGGTFGEGHDISQIWMNIHTTSPVAGIGNPNTGQPVDICCGLQSGNVEYIQPSPVKIERWTVDSPSADTLKDIVAEDSYNYNGFMRKVIVINIKSPLEIIDKETGILLFHHDNWFSSADHTIKLVDTNIIQSSNFP